MAARKQAFIELLRAAVAESMREAPPRAPVSLRAMAYVDSWLSALRIGIPDPRGDLLTGIIRELNEGFTDSRLSSARRALVLLARWARETGDPTFTRELFNQFGPRWSPIDFNVLSGRSLGKIDVDKLAISLDLSYREATDLRWVVDTLRGRPPAPRRSARKGSG